MVDGRAAGRGGVVGGGGADQRTLGLILTAAGVVVFDDVILSAEQGDDGWNTKSNRKTRDIQGRHGYGLLNGARDTKTQTQNND